VNEADDALDIITLMGVLILFVPIMVYCTIPFMMGNVGGFGVQIEKSAPETNSEIPASPPEVFTTDEILLMLAVADKNAPKPKNVRLNVGAVLEIPINDDFLANKIEVIQSAKLTMPVTEPVQMTLHSGTSGMRFWEVHR
jgi:hypothetical protein